MNDKRKDIEILLKNTSGWNGGGGLIVPPHAAKLLREMGYTSGYTEAKMVPDGKDKFA